MLPMFFYTHVTNKAPTAANCCQILKWFER